MAKRGGTKHLKRLAISKAIVIHTKKGHKWLLKPSPGPHPKKTAVPLGVLIRDSLGLARTAKEVKIILNQKLIEIDGVTRTDSHYPIGFMDIISIPKSSFYYQMRIDSHGRLVPYEIPKEKAQTKILKVIGKRTLKKGKTRITLHDGRNIFADKINVSDSVIIKLPEVKVEKIIKLEPGALCFIREGKHAGTVATLKELIKRERRPTEAKLNWENGEFVTVARYLLAIDSL